MGYDGVAIKQTHLPNNYLNKNVKSMEQNSLWKFNIFSTGFE